MFKTMLSAILMAGALTASAAAQSTFEEAKKAGFVRVGFPNQIPYAYADEKGRLTGADAEVARLVVEKMGIGQMDPVLTEFSALIPGLRAKRFDIVLAMFVNPQRCQQVAFSEPIYGIGQALVVAKGNPIKFATFDDLKSKDARIAVMAGAVQAGYLKQMSVPADKITVLPDMLSAANAIRGGRVDVFPISALPARRLVQSLGDNPGVELVEGFPDPLVDGRPARGYGAFAFRKEDSSLLVAFNTALKEVLGSPAHLAAISPFGFDQANLPDRSTADLCK
jgi:polar amino acid transport system substrate-binding protein